MNYEIFYHPIFKEFIATINDGDHDYQISAENKKELLTKIANL